MVLGQPIKFGKHYDTITIATQSRPTISSGMIFNPDPLGNTTGGPTSPGWFGIKLDASWRPLLYYAFPGAGGTTGAPNSISEDIWFWTDDGSGDRELAVMVQ